MTSITTVVGPYSSGGFSAANPHPSTAPMGTVGSKFPFHNITTAARSEVTNEADMWRYLQEVASVDIPKQRAVLLMVNELLSEETIATRILPIREVHTMEWEEVRTLINPVAMEELAPGAMGPSPYANQFTELVKLGFSGVSMSTDSLALQTKDGLQKFWMYLKAMEISILQDIELRSYAELLASHTRYATYKAKSRRGNRKQYPNVARALAKEVYFFGCWADKLKNHKLLDMFIQSILRYSGGFKPNIIIVPDGCKTTAVHRSSSADYARGGEIANRIATDGDGVMVTYRGCKIETSHHFENVGVDDPMVRNRVVGEYNTTSSCRLYLDTVGLDGFLSRMTTKRLFSLEGDGRFEEINQQECLKCCGRFDGNGKLIQYTESDLLTNNDNRKIMDLNNSQRDWEHDPLYLTGDYLRNTHRFDLDLDPLSWVKYAHEVVNGTTHKVTDATPTRRIYAVYEKAGLIEHFNRHFEEHFGRVRQTLPQMINVGGGGGTFASHGTVGNQSVTQNLAFFQNIFPALTCIPNDLIQAVEKRYQAQNPPQGGTQHTDVSANTVKSLITMLYAFASWRYFKIFIKGAVDTNRDLFELCLNMNVPLPFAFCLFRRHMTYRMGACIVTCEGQNIGFNAVMLPDTVWTLNGTQKLYVGNYTHYAASVIQHPEAIRTHMDMVWCGVVGGGSLKMIELTKGVEVMVRDNTLSPDMRQRVSRIIRGNEFSPAYPDGMNARTGHVRCYLISLKDAENMDTAVNVMGVWAERWRAVIRNTNARQDGLKLHFSTAMYYNWLTSHSFSYTDTHLDTTGRNRARDLEKCENNVCLVGASYGWDIAARDLKAFSESCAHGGRTYEGCLAVREGLAGEHDETRYIQAS